MSCISEFNYSAIIQTDELLLRSSKYGYILESRTSLKMHNRLHTSEVNLESLHDYYAEKFSCSDYQTSDTVRQAELDVSDKYSTERDKADMNFIMTKSMLPGYAFTTCRQVTYGMCNRH